MNQLTYAQRLRLLADFYDAHPELPTGIFPGMVYTWLDGIATAARTAASIPGSRKKYSDDNVFIQIPVPGLAEPLEFFTSRESVCEPVETEVVEVPAKTEVRVLKWKCQPLLGLEAAVAQVPLDNDSTI